MGKFIMHVGSRPTLWLLLVEICHGQRTNNPRVP